MTPAELDVREVESVCKGTWILQKKGNDGGPLKYKQGYFATALIEGSLSKRVGDILSASDT